MLTSRLSYVFLILSFIFFSLFLMTSLAHATGMGGNNTLTYWQNHDNTQCAASLDSLCQSAFSGSKSDNADCTTDSVTCPDNGMGAILMNLTCKNRDPWGNLTGATHHEIGALQNLSFYHKNTIECKAGEHLKLDGCNASCEPGLNKCAEKAGQEEHRKQQCGVAHGSNCHWQDSTNKLIVCDSHQTDYAPLTGTKTSIDGCEVLIGEANPSLTGGNQDLSENPDPAGAMPVMCDLTLQYTGEETPLGTTSDLNNPPAPTKSLTSPESTENKTKPDGSTEKTTKSTKTNADGSKTTTTTTETTHPDGTKTTTTATSTTPSTTTGTGTGTTCPTGQTASASGSCDSQTENFSTPSTSGSLTKPEDIKNTVSKSFWIPIYTNGLSGVWNDNSNNLNNTPIFNALNQFKSGIPNSGSCPSFPLIFLQYSGSISPPCFIWPFLRAVFLFSTMMVCRRIVFGG